MQTKPTPTQQQSEPPIVEPNDPDRALVIFTDSGDAYKLDQDDWQIDDFAFAITAGDQGIINQLDSFGSYLAVVQKNDGATTFINQRAILKNMGVPALQSLAQTTTPGPTTTDAETLTVLGDDGRVYVLESQTWRVDEFKLNPETGSDRIAEKLAELGSYVAFVRKDIALQIGACCTVVNLRGILAGQNTETTSTTQTGKERPVRSI
jgi:hypothetical protein